MTAHLSFFCTFLLILILLQHYSTLSFLTLSPSPSVVLYHSHLTQWRQSKSVFFPWSLSVTLINCLRGILIKLCRDFSINHPCVASASRVRCDAARQYAALLTYRSPTIFACMPWCKRSPEHTCTMQTYVQAQWRNCEIVADKQQPAIYCMLERHKKNDDK